MRKLGFQAIVLEHRTAWGRVDVWGADVLACHPKRGIVLVQAYMLKDAQAHKHLFEGHPEISRWLISGGNFLHQMWRREGKRGKRKKWVVDTFPLVPPN